MQLSSIKAAEKNVIIVIKYAQRESNAVNVACIYAQIEYSLHWFDDCCISALIKKVKLRIS